MSKKTTTLTASACLCILLFVSSTGAQDFSLIKDFSSSLIGMNGAVTINNTTFIALDDLVHGVELWKSDLTDAGTVMVKDIKPGDADSYPEYLCNNNGILYFTARDSAHGAEIWKSDGTESGTVMIRDIELGIAGSSPTELTALNGVVYFTAESKLYRTNGTSAGTTLVKQTGGTVSNLHSYHGELYFFSRHAGEHQLWKSDGTSAGTVMLKNIYTEMNYNRNDADFEESNGMLYFIIYTGHFGADLWKTDGTEAGTQLVKNYFTGNNDDPLPMQLTDVNGTLYFAGIYMDLQWSYEIWKSDGTEAGTQIVGDIFPYNNFSPGNLTHLNGTLLFSAEGSLWRSDGTQSGTVIIKEEGSPGDFYVVGDLLYFTVFDNHNGGTELWVSDGTECGTQLAADINPGSESSSPDIVATNGNTLILSATQVNYGEDLWRYEAGSPPIKLIVKKVSTSICPGNVEEITFDFVCEAASDNVYAVELSDPSGNFSTPTIIGSLISSSQKDTVTCIIPNGIAEGDHYRVRVTASNPGIVGNDNGEDISIGCPVPDDLAVTKIKNSSAKLSWHQVSCAEKFQVKYREDGTTSWTTLKPETNSQKITGLISNTEYEAKVRSTCAKNPNAYSSYSSLIRWTTSSKQTLDEELASALNINPNPASDYVSIEFTLTNYSSAEIAFFDLEGRKVKTIVDGNFEEGNHILNVSTEELSKGVYVVRMQTPTGSHNLKLILE